jgi:hypothetical protein
VVAAIPDPSTPPEYVVDRPGQANRKTLHTAREPRRLVCLRQQMEMIGLNAELKEAKGIA